LGQPSAHTTVGTGPYTAYPSRLSSPSVFGLTLSVSVPGFHFVFDSSVLWAGLLIAVMASHVPVDGECHQSGNQIIFRPAF
jgi:hypothetical protein